MMASFSTTTTNPRCPCEISFSLLRLLALALRVLFSQRQFIFLRVNIAQRGYQREAFNTLVGRGGDVHVKICFGAR